MTSATIIDLNPSLSQRAVINRALNLPINYRHINLFHELFGHGVFFERSRFGRELVNLETQLRSMQVGASAASFDEEDIFQKQDEIDGYVSRVHDRAEGFALWMEHFLSINLGYENLFEEKFDLDLSPGVKKSFLDAISFERNHGQLAFFGEMGLPLDPKVGEIKTLLLNMYGETLKDSPLCIYYGSKSPESDVDIFVVSDSIQPYFNGWLDVKSLSVDELHKRGRCLDVTVSDPFFSGEMVGGAKEFLETNRRIMSMRPITPAAIKYNEDKWRESEVLRDAAKTGTDDWTDYVEMSRTYQANFLELCAGNKHLTYDSLKKSPSFKKIGCGGLDEL